MDIHQRLLRATALVLIARRRAVEERERCMFTRAFVQAARTRVAERRSKRRSYTLNRTVEAIVSTA